MNQNHPCLDPLSSFEVPGIPDFWHVAISLQVHVADHHQAFVSMVNFSVVSWLLLYFRQALLYTHREQFWV
jgi:hypothetical protein